jgi:ATP-binding cassette subfamily F protein 3
MEALQDYQGTLVFVSHDRYFLDGLATKVLEIGDLTAVSYLGNYEDYLAKKSAAQVETEIGEAGSTWTLPPVAKAEVDESRQLWPRKKKKVNPHKIQGLTERIRGVEAAIDVHETRIAVLAKMLATEELYRDHQLFRTTMQEHDRLQSELDSLMQQWEDLQSELATLQA